MNKIAVLRNKTMEDNFEDSAAWVDESYDSPLASTTLPELFEGESTAVGSLIIIVVVAVCTIALLFVMAVFIDCRQQKIINMKTAKTRKVLRLPMPTIGRKPTQEDEENFADRFQVPQSAPPEILVY